MFFACNRFLLHVSKFDQWRDIRYRDWIKKTDRLLPFVSQLTVKICRTSSKFEKDDDKHPTITLRHNPKRNCWSIASSDDWSGIEDEEDRASLERDSSTILPHLLSCMLEGRSRSELSTDYLDNLIDDLEHLFDATKVTINSSGETELRTEWERSPDDYERAWWTTPRRPPDMYTRFLYIDEYNLPCWAEPWPDERGNSTVRLCKMEYPEGHEM